MKLSEDEERWIIANEADRCKACGHLAIFHNYHCCEFCLVEDCPCSWGEMLEASDEAE